MVRWFICMAISILYGCVDTSGVECTKYKVTAQMLKDSLTISVLSDLPDDTDINVSVDRPYFERGQSDSSNLSVLNKTMKLATLREGHDFVIDEKSAMQRWAKTREVHAKAGNALEIDRFSDVLELSVSVYAGQTNPRFGLRNVNLKGTCNFEDSSGLSLRIISWKKTLPSAMVHEPPPLKFASAYNLTVGMQVELSRKTPLMPHHSPTDPTNALGNMKYIPAGGSISITDSYLKNGSQQWYKVAAQTRTRGPIGRGWVNANALMGQNLVRLP